MAPRMTGISVYVYVDNHVHDDMYADVYVYVSGGFCFTSISLSCSSLKYFFGIFLNQEFFSSLQNNPNLQEHFAT